MTELNVKLIKRMQRNYERKLARYNLIFRRILRPVIEDQEARFMQKLPLITKPTYRNIMDIEQENHIVGLAMRPVYITVATEAAEELLGQYKMFVKSVSPRMLLSQKIFDYANKYSLAMSGYINKTTSKKIKKLILRGFKDNLTYGQMAKKIKTDIFKDLSQGYRAKALARTECHGMVENGSFEAAKASKVIKEKTWSAAADARETHGEANYQTVKLTDQYVVGGYLMNFPGDTSFGAGLEEIMNCRCSSLYSSKIHKDRITTTKELLARYEKPIELPRRAHLAQDMNPDDYIHYLMSDAESRGITLSYDDASDYCKAIRAYTSNGRDQGIRIFQHGGLQGLKDAGYNPGEIKQLMNDAKNLEKFLKISAKYKEDMVFRGINLDFDVWSRLKPGQIFDMQGTSSFSSEFIAARSKGNVVFAVMKNKTGVSVRHISAYGGEKEILFSNLAKFRITGIKSTEMGVFVSLEEIAFAPKLKLIIPLTRGHLRNMSDYRQIEQIIKDAKIAGKELTYKQAAAINDNIVEFTRGSYKVVREYQVGGLEEIKGLGAYRQGQIVRMTNNVEDYIKYAPKYKGQILRNILLEPSEKKALMARLKAGHIIDMKGTSFWTSSDEISSIFGDIQFIVKNPKSAVSITHLSDYGFDAKELLFSNKIKFKILDIREVLRPGIHGKVYSRFTVFGSNPTKVLQITLEEIVSKPKLFVPVWKPVMTQAEADAWAKGSKFANEIFYHGTSKKNVTKITIEGFRLENLGKTTNNGGLLGAGHYTTPSSIDTGFYSGQNVLNIKTKLFNVCTDIKVQSKIRYDAWATYDAAKSMGNLTLSEARKQASKTYFYDVLEQINKKDWIAIKKIVKTEKWAIEKVTTYLYKKSGYDGVRTISELCVFDDKSLVVIQQEAAKLPTAMKATAEQLRKSLEAYQDGAFQPINELLRNQKIVPAQLGKIMPDIANMDSLMKASTDDFYLFRGDGAGISANLFPGIEGLPTRVSAEQTLFGRIDGKTYAQFLNDKLKGKIFRDTGFVSTSIDSKLVIDRFVSGSTELTEHGAVGFVEIMAPKGTKMINVENVSLMGAKENEMILSRGTAFKIEHVNIVPYPSESTTVRFYIKYLVSIVKVH